jgi:hypothetical protein
MISIYRGHDTGLAGQSTKSLLGLLKYYEVITTTSKQHGLANETQNKDAQSTPVKREPEVRKEGSVRIKREREDAVGGRGTGKKAKKEVIVLDD